MPELTPQQRLLETLYRGRSAARPPNVQQQSLNNALKKPSVTNYQKTQGAKPSPSAIKASAVRAYKAKVKGDFSRFNKEASASASKFRASSAQNISKFGGGVKSRVSPTLNVVKAVATKQGIKAASLSRVLASGRFLAGANSVPALGLSVAAFTLWKKNIEDIYKIYGQTPFWLNNSLPTHSVKVVSEVPPPFTGGQDPVQYHIKASCKVEYWYWSRAAFFKQGIVFPSIDTSTVSITIVGPISNLSFESAGRCPNGDPSLDPCTYGGSTVNLVITDSQGIKRVRTLLWTNEPFTGGVISPSNNHFCKKDTFTDQAFEIKRADGQPDTGGNPSGGSAGVYSTSITTVNNTTIVNNVINNTPANHSPNSQPSVVNNYYAAPTAEPKTEPIPVTIPTVEALPDDNIDKEPESPTDNPPIKTENLIVDDTSKKPKATGITTQRYPRSKIELDEILKVIELDKAKTQLNYDSPLEEKEEEILEDRGWYSFKPNLFLRNAAKEAGFDVKELPSTKITKNPQARQITVLPSTTNPSTDSPITTPTVINSGNTSTVVNEPKTIVNPPIVNTPSEPKDTFPTPTQIAVAVGGLDILRQIVNKPTPTLTCLAPVYVPPVEVQAKANGTAIATLQGVTITQNAVLQKTANVINTATKKTVEVVTHKDYGLQKIQSFASTAWSTTRGDKIMNGINTMLLIHNAIMLSNNIGQTIGYATSQGLSVIGIKDPTTGEALDINSLVGKKIKSVISNAIGNANYEALTAKLRAANRVYQTGANVLTNVRSMIDSTQDIAETTGENVSVIGNALRKAGVVRENAYSLMPENLNNTSRVLNRLEKISDAASAIEDVTSNAVDIKEEIADMKESRKEFDEAKQELTKELNTSEAKQKKANLEYPEPKEEDELRGTEPEKQK